MNIWFVVAAILSVGLTLIHIIAGETVVHRPVLRSELSVEMKTAVSVLWHGVTVLLVVSTIVLITAAFGHIRGMSSVWVVAMINLLMTGVFVFYGISRHRTLLRLPQWIALVTITAFIIIGME